jgi:hypothetical protein
MLTIAGTQIKTVLDSSGATTNNSSTQLLNSLLDTFNISSEDKISKHNINSKVGDVSNLVFQSIAAGINALFNIDIGTYNTIQESQADTKAPIKRIM